MTYDEVIKTLKARGTAQARKTYGRHGAQGTLLGVSFVEFGKLTKQIKQNHVLAEKLWASRVFDAQLLAAMIADPKQMDAKAAARWAKSVDSYPLVDAFSKLVSQSPEAETIAEALLKSKDEFVAAAGWSLLAAGARSGAMPAGECRKRLKEIEKTIHSERNRVKHSMNSALICIGSRGGELTDQAIAAAGRIGQVEVDHGDTDCKTPDAIAYIRKMLARAEKKPTKE
jgi:3-methyladenine DNA glycosylase AlkD